MADISKIKTPDNTTYNIKDANAVTGSGTSGYLAKFNGSKSITNGPQLGSSTTTFLRNDGNWAAPAGFNKIFTVQPTPPYTEGDLWINEDNNISVCVNSRASGSFSSDDWGSAVETMSTEQLNNAIDSEVAGAITIVTGNGENGGNIILRRDASGTPYELLVTNSPTSYLSSGKIYRWDSSGLRYTSGGYNGTYTSIINSDGQIPTSILTGNINASVTAIQNFTAAMINGGKLERGDANNAKGTIELKDGNGTVIAEISNAGFKFYSPGTDTDRPYYLINTNGLIGYTKVGGTWTQTIKVAFDEFRMTKGYVRDELDIGGMIKIVPMDTGTNAGIAFVASV